jgi:hypothetical protein
VTKMKHWYVGHKGGARQVFASLTTPTVASHGAQFAQVVGPFRTKRAAVWAASQCGNPHYQHVRDAERIVRELPR